MKENIELPANVAHEYPWSEPRLPDPTGEYGHWSQPLCGYCGSLPATVLLELLKDHPGTQLSMADWKYGWPHKMYVDKLPVPQRILDMNLQRVVSSRYENGRRIILGTEPYTNDFAKFYTVHLRDITTEQWTEKFDELVSLLKPRLGLEFCRDGQDDIKWRWV